MKTFMRDGHPTVRQAPSGLWSDNFGPEYANTTRIINMNNANVKMIFIALDSIFLPWSLSDAQHGNPWQ